MSDFSHLDKLSLSEDQTAIYTIDQIKGAPELICAPATSDNKPFFNEALKKSKAGRRNKKSINTLVVDRNREEDKEVFARFVLKGWRGVNDSSGKEVKFSKESALDFLKAIPDWIFDDLREWSTDPLNFIEIEVDEDTVKN